MELRARTNHIKESVSGFLCWTANEI